MPSVRTDDGVSINYYLDDYLDPWLEERSKETIVMHPAMWEPATFVAPMVPTLARQYRCVRIDMRGRGLSTAPPATRTLSGGPDESTLAERQARDAMSVLDHLGIEAASWFGQGGGGLTGLAAACLWPGRVKALAMSGSPLKLPASFLEACSLGEPSMAAALEKYGVEEFNRRGVWRQVIDHTRLDSRMAAWVAAERNKVPLDVMLRTARCMQVFDFTDWLPRVTCPTLLITAELEKSVPLEQQRYMEKAIANARLIVYEAVGRGIHLFHADQVARDVLDFLESQRR
jgi:3-oxoadipate enol-lactonase